MICLNILWMKNIACHISKQRMLWPSSHHVTAMSMVSPEGTQDRNRMPTIKPSATAATPVPQQGTLRRLRMRKHRILALDSWRAHQRNDFSEPRLLHLLIHSKVLNSVTSLISNHFSMFWLPGLCCKNSYNILGSSLRYFGAASQSYLRGCVPGLSPQFCPSNKT